MDYKKYYNLEEYLLGEVKNNFHKNGYLTTEEFFCIVIWKANRAKTKIKNKLIRFGVLSSMVKNMTREIFKASAPQKKLEILLEKWKFSMPMATAILTILYPNDFTVYDIRVREQLGIKDFSGRKNQVEKYFLEFLPMVKKNPGKNLRDKDRILWGKSFHEDLKLLLKK